MSNGSAIDHARTRASRLPVEGLWGFPLTPFDGDDVDQGLYAAGVRRQVTGGLDALCIAGAIAQGEVLREHEKLACLRTTLELAGPDLPVILSITQGAGDDELAAAAAREGISGILLVPTTDALDELEKTLKRIAAAAPGIDIVLYHRPPALLDVNDLTRLCRIEELRGLKDGHRDVRLFRQLFEALGGRLIWISAWEDVAVPFWAVGARVFSPFSSAYAPDYSRMWFSALQRGDLDGAISLLRRHAYPMVDLRTARPGIDVAVVKAAMEACGLEPGALRAPAAELTAAEREAAIALVDRLGSGGTDAGDAGDQA